MKNVRYCHEETDQECVMLPDLSPWSDSHMEIDAFAFGSAFKSAKLLYDDMGGHSSMYDSTDDSRTPQMVCDTVAYSHTQDVLARIGEEGPTGADGSALFGAGGMEDMGDVMTHGGLDGLLQDAMMHDGGGHGHSHGASSGMGSSHMSMDHAIHGSQGLSAGYGNISGGGAAAVAPSPLSDIFDHAQIAMPLAPFGTGPMEFDLSMPTNAAWSIIHPSMVLRGSSNSSVNSLTHAAVKTEPIDMQEDFKPSASASAAATAAPPVLVGFSSGIVKEEEDSVSPRVSPRTVARAKRREESVDEAVEEEDDQDMGTEVKQEKQQQEDEEGPPSYVFPGRRDPMGKDMPNRGRHMCRIDKCTSDARWPDYVCGFHGGGRCQFMWWDDSVEACTNFHQSRNSHDELLCGRHSRLTGALYGDHARNRSTGGGSGSRTRGRKRGGRKGGSSSRK